MPALFQFFGRLHPLILHAPIGLLIGLVALELIALARRSPLAPGTRITLAWLVALSAALAAGTGFVLHLEGGYNESTADLHQWLGIGVAAGAVLAAIALQAGRPAVFRILLFATAAAIIPAGHFGNTLTRGSEFLTEPFNAAAPPSPTQPQPTPPVIQTVSAPLYTRDIAPLFARYCVECHGGAHRKARLALNTPDAITKGSRRGPVVAAGDAAHSKLIARLRLPLDDEDHMPPPDEPQPTPEDIKSIEEWIAAGAAFDTPPPALAPGAEPEPVTAPPAATGAVEPAAPPEPPPPEPAALKALEDRLIHAEPIRRGSHLLMIDCAAVARQLSDDDLRTLLQPLLQQTADLSIARTRATDALMPLIAQMPSLRRLNAAATSITDTGLAALAKHPKLEDLLLSQTRVSGAAADTLASLPALKRVYLWKSAVTPEGLAALRERKIPIDAGDAPAAEAVEAETNVALTNNPSTPAPPAAPAAAAAPLKPINTTCPVTGKPLNPDYSVIYKGRIIGFCCQHCAAQFLEDPDKFAANLPK